MISDRQRVALALTLVVVLLSVVLSVVVWHLKNTYWKAARFFGAPIPVQVVRVGAGTVTELLPAEGIAKEFEIVPLSALVTGRVTAINVRLGETVRKGQRLVEIDATALLSQLATAEAQLAASRQELELHARRAASMQELFSRQLVAENELHEALLKKLAAEKAVAQNGDAVVQTSVNLASARIDSPVNGIVTVRDVYVGATLRGQTPVMTVAQTDPILVQASYAEDKIRDIYIGQPARVSLYAFPNRFFEGKVRWINPTVDPTTRLMAVQVILPNADLKLQPGMRGIVWLGARQPEVLRVPGIAVLSAHEDLGYVFVVDESGTARVRQIRTGGYAEGFMEVKRGLQPGERVVVVGQVGLKENDKVRIFDENGKNSVLQTKP
jgi:membrane fusion protein, multidrug efflux system